MNTVQKGSVRCIVFKEKDTWYAVALEFNIVESSDDPAVAQNNLQEAIQGYVESQRKIKGSRVSPLNQKSDKEYEELWKNLISNKKMPIKSPYKVKYFGVAKI
jgi:predicted RNase H-like HicB family nuclease